MVPAQYRQSGFTDFLAPGVNWASVLKSLQDDEFCLDPTRMTLVCGTAGFDGTQFKGILSNRYSIQLNKTSRNSVLFQSNINNTRSDVAHLVRVLAEIATIFLNQVAAAGLYSLEDFRLVCEQHPFAQVLQRVRLLEAARLRLLERALQVGQRLSHPAQALETLRHERQ